MLAKRVVKLASKLNWVHRLSITTLWEATNWPSPPNAWREKGPMSWGKTGSRRPTKIYELLDSLHWPQHTENKYQAAEKCNWYRFTPWEKILVANTSTEGNPQIQDKQHPGWLTAKWTFTSHNISQLIQASDPQVYGRVWLNSCECTRSRLRLSNNPAIRQIVFQSF